MKKISGNDKVERIISIILSEEKQRRQDLIKLRNAEIERDTKTRKLITIILIVCITALSLTSLAAIFGLVYTKNNRLDKLNEVPPMEFIVPDTTNNFDEPILVPSLGPIVLEPEIVYPMPTEFKVMTTELNEWVVDEEYQKMAFDVAEKYGFDYLWMIAMIAEERSFNNAGAVNDNGDSKDIGITQFNNKNKDIIRIVTKCEDDDILFNPWANIRCSAYLINRNRTYYKEVQTPYEEFICYNGGLGAVKKYIAGKPIAATLNYADEAMANYKLLQKEYFE